MGLSYSAPVGNDRNYSFLLFRQYSSIKSVAMLTGSHSEQWSVGLVLKYREENAQSATFMYVSS